MQNQNTNTIPNNQEIFLSSDRLKKYFLLRGEKYSNFFFSNKFLEVIKTYRKYTQTITFTSFVTRQSPAHLNSCLQMNSHRYAPIHILWSFTGLCQHKLV